MNEKLLKLICKKMFADNVPVSIKAVESYWQKINKVFFENSHPWDHLDIIYAAYKLNFRNFVAENKDFTMPKQQQISLTIEARERIIVEKTYLLTESAYSSDYLELLFDEHGLDWWDGEVIKEIELDHETLERDITQISKYS